MHFFCFIDGEVKKLVTEIPRFKNIDVWKGRTTWMGCKGNRVCCVIALNHKVFNPAKILFDVRIAYKQRHARTRTSILYQMKT